MGLWGFEQSTKEPLWAGALKGRKTCPALRVPDKSPRSQRGLPGRSHSLKTSARNTGFWKRKALQCPGFYYVPLLARSSSEAGDRLPLKGFCTVRLSLSADVISQIRPN